MTRLVFGSERANEIAADLRKMQITRKQMTCPYCGYLFYGHADAVCCGKYECYKQWEADHANDIFKEMDSD